MRPRAVADEAPERADHHVRPAHRVVGLHHRVQVLALAETTLAPLTEDAEIARVAAPAAAVLYAAYGLDDLVRVWLDRGTHPHSPRWRDRVLLALMRWSVERGDLAGARRRLAEVKTPDLRDPAHETLARTLAVSAPQLAVTGHLEAIEDEARRAALATELGRLPQVTGTPQALYGVLLVLQEAPEALAEFLERLVDDYPGSPLVEELDRVFRAEREPSGGGHGGAIPAWAYGDLCAHPETLRFLGHRSRPRLEALQARLVREGREAAAARCAAFAALLVEEGLLDVNDSAALADALVSDLQVE